MAGKPRKSEQEMQMLEDVCKTARANADLEITGLKEKQIRIAECNRFVGRIQAAEAFGKMATVSTLMWLKDVKESRLYHDLPGMETWDKFCESLGKSRRLIDEQLLNLEELGSEFLETVSSLRVGYRDLRKLRKLTHDGTVTIDIDAVEIGGERIPLKPECKEDLQAALERILDEKDKALKNEKKLSKRILGNKEEVNNKLEKRIIELEGKAEQKGLTLEEDTYLERLYILETSFDGYLLQIRNVVHDLANVQTERTSAKLIAFINQARMELNVYYDTAVDYYAPKNMIPEEEWQLPFERENEASMK